MADRWNGCSTGSSPKKHLEWICWESASMLYTTYNLQPSKSSHNHGHLWRKENQQSEEKRSVMSPREKDLYHWTRTVDAQGKDWSAFLSSGENKTELIRFLVEYYKSQTVRCIFHRSCSYIPICNIIWLICNVIWMIAVYMYLYTFTSNVFCTYYRSNWGSLSSLQTCNTWLVSPEDVTLLETCNHHEADTRIDMCHCLTNQ